MNILLVDDEKTARFAARAYLEREGHTVYEAKDGREALDLFDERAIDFVVLDLMLPMISGEDVCREIRRSSNAPIIMLTAKGAEEERLNGLDLGADDYIVKPFSPRELVARVKTIMRRLQPATVEPVLRFKGGLILYLAEKRAEAAGAPIDLTRQEFNLLHLLARNPKIAFTREHLLAKAFAMAYEGSDRTIDTHIKNLRKKIEADARHPHYIETVHGLGYRFGGELLN